VGRGATRCAGPPGSTLHQPGDSRNRHVIAASRSRHVAEHLIPDLIPTNTASTGAVRTDRVRRPHWRRRKLRTPVRAQPGFKDRRARIAAPAGGNEAEVAQGQGARRLAVRSILGCPWRSRAWILGGDRHDVLLPQVVFHPALSGTSVRAGAESDPVAWGGSSPPGRVGAPRKSKLAEGKRVRTARSRVARRGRAAARRR
jgi:hypothetical protein